MFLVRWLRKLLSLPAYWPGLAAAAFKLPQALPLLKAAFYISGDGSAGRAALIVTHRHLGLEAARLQAQEWMARRPRVEIAGFAGALALDAGDLDSARALLASGRRLGDDRDGMLDLVEYVLAGSSADGSAAKEAAARFAARNDLPSALSRLICSSLMWQHLLGGRFDQARRAADHILQIEDWAQAELALWALELRDGRCEAAQGHLGRANCLPAQKLYFQVLGAHAVGQAQQADRLLEQLREVDAARAEQAGKLIGSREAPK